jgi:2',3'-cyclic-nucleotide 2'-phosphodiesterase (5'-nucleotidase family)
MILISARFSRGLALIGAGLMLFVLPILSQPRQITILHTNDMHASFLPHEAYWLRSTPKPLVGGFNELAFAVDSIRRIRTTSFVFDAGDLMTGNPISDRSYKGAEGGALVEMMNLIGYEGWTPGNHDFDISYANLLKLVAIAKFPVVQCNLTDEKTGKPITDREYAIIEKNGIKAGIFGVMSSEYYGLVSKKSTRGVNLMPTIKIARRLIEMLRPQVDLVVAITHVGVDEDSLIAINVKGLDVIIGGHSHTRLKQPKYINGVIIAQTGSNCENLGVLDLTVENHSVTRWNGELHQLWYHPDRKTVVTALVDSFKNEIDKEYSEVIGTWTVETNAEGSDRRLGNFLCEAQREAAGADLGFVNNGGIRKKFAAGPITKQDLFEVLPFRNILVSFKLTGKQVRGIVLQNIKERSGFQLSGVECEWKRDAEGKVEFVKLLVNGKPVEDQSMYTGAASDYMMGEAKRYLGIDAPELTFMDETVFNATERIIRAMKNVPGTMKGGIKELK